MGTPGRRAGHSEGAAWWRLLLRQFTSPIMLVLIGATAVSMAVSDRVDGAIILVIIVASGLLGFFQERRAQVVMTQLLDRVRIHADVIREGREIEIPLDEVVVGDEVVLRPGDVIPADLRLVESRNLLVDESTMSGESIPVEKRVVVSGEEAPVAYLGTHVVSGSGRGLVTAVGEDTEFGVLEAHLAGPGVRTRFELQMRGLGILLTRVILILTVAIVAINWWLQHPLVESLMFALALAVGVTPQLLPAIIAVSLSAGARQMARESVLVKRLDVIEDIGSMSILCCDKTGTLTQGVVSLDHARDLEGHESRRVLRLAALNACLQQGYPNALDQAVARRAHGIDGIQALAEVPYDFERRRLSVLVGDPEPILITKGAFEQVVGLCSQARTEDGVVSASEVAEVVQRAYEDLSAEGYRVLAVATKSMSSHVATVEDECEETLEGIIAFWDPPTDNAAEAVARLKELKVDLALITGDNASVATAVARAVGLSVQVVLTGGQLATLTPDQMPEAIASCRVFAAVDPLQKEAIVRAFRSQGQTVGFLGDGVNDAAALRVADVGISVEGAADVSKSAAALVILDKNLDVIADGVRLGRKTFVNTIKYVRITVSSNFGNMLSLVIAGILLPFFPLLPMQILLLNLICDAPAMAISTDRVDPEDEARPTTWSSKEIRNFMIVFGLVSSVFDVSVFLIYGIALQASADEFRSVWFTESLLTAITAFLVLRSRRSLWRSRPSATLALSAGLMALVGVAIPALPDSSLLGFTPVPVTFLAGVVAIWVLYVVSLEGVKALRRLPRVTENQNTASG